MATPNASDILGHVTLLTGPEELLNERAVAAAHAAVGTADPEAEFSETTADQLSMAALGDLASPSLFSTIRCVVVRAIEDLPEDAHAGLVGYAAAPAEDVGLVLVHSGGMKGKGLLDKPVSYTHLRAHETDSYLVCRLLLEKKKKKNYHT